jgi:hypothetical protein
VYFLVGAELLIVFGLCLRCVIDVGYKVAVDVVGNLFTSFFFFFYQLSVFLIFLLTPYLLLENTINSIDLNLPLVFHP